MQTRGDEVQLVCSHGKTDYTFMQWYQKSPGDQALKRIGHLNYNNKEHEKSFEKHFNITGDLSGSKPKNASMFIVDLKPEHSAVYYCAANDKRYISAYCVSGVSESVLITQWPHYISNPSNGLVKMHCYQNDTDYQYLYWYKQPRGKSFQLIVATVAGISQFEEGFKSGFQAEKNDKQWSLTITSIQEKDEAVYLCAARLHGTEEGNTKLDSKLLCY
uniref:Ig-like domain-containing protein n=1 Tax=Haplochromis burtoni TaxID=8153 RepID=A0A3Q2VXC9_HAPBU